MKIYKNKMDTESINNKSALSEYRGFVTIATGDEKYHRMAYILMQSYKMTTNTPFRFAVITDRESRYIDKFDDIIIIEDASRTYMDKIELLVNAPYRENIFIDADCIAYNDLNEYWKCFEHATDFSAFGRILPENAKDGWYTKGNLGKYSQLSQNILDIHGGIYFIRPGKVCNEMYSICKDIICDYDKFDFRRFKKPADEPILALAMSINGCLPVNASQENYAWLRRSKKIQADFFEKKLNYYFDKKITINGMLMHFGTAHTITPLYLIESKKVLFYANNTRKWNLKEKIFSYVEGTCKGFFLCVKYSWKKVIKMFNI